MQSFVHTLLNYKRKRKPKGQSRRDNPERDPSRSKFTDVVSIQDLQLLGDQIILSFYHFHTSEYINWLIVV